MNQSKILYMSKFFQFILAVAVLATSSCMKEDYLLARRGCDVTFIADLGGSVSRAFADGENVNEVAWAVYTAGSDTPLKDLWGTMPLNDRQAVLDIRLVNGRSYDIVFFAYYTENPSDKIEINGNIDPRYYNVLFDSKKVSIKYDEHLTISNDEMRDCFWHVERNLKIGGAVNKTFTLTRPLAQLNLGVTEEDYNLALNAGFRIADTQITVDSYTEFDLFSGELTEPAPTTIHFARSETPLYGDNFLEIQGQPSKYRYLATTYLLVNEKCTSEVRVALWDVSNIELHRLIYSFVPFQRNYRTNIIGHLLTNPHNFTIIIEDKFENDYDM